MGITWEKRERNLPKFGVVVFPSGFCYLHPCLDSFSYNDSPFLRVPSSFHCPRLLKILLGVTKEKPLSFGQVRGGRRTNLITLVV